MSLILLLALQAAAGPADADRRRYAECMATIAHEPVAAERMAEAWQASGGGVLARQCLGLALAKQGRFSAAADAFEYAARLAQPTDKPQAAGLWAQAGNARLAAGDATKAKLALDEALVPGVLDGLARGEALLDRARAAVAGGNVATARTDLDAALVLAADDPLAWLLSATLARRGGDLTRAKADIAQAIARADDDASVHLEAGNIAAATGDAESAKAAWQHAAVRAPEGSAGKAASAALAQFEAPAG